MWTKCISRQTHNYFQSLRWNSTKPITKDLPKIVNLVRLVGAVTTDVYTNSASKAKWFYLRTFNEDNFYDTHKIFVPAFAIENLPNLPKTGQKLLITGTLRTSNFTQNNGKRGTSLQINAQQIYLCDNGEAGKVEQTENPNNDPENQKSNITESKNNVMNFELKDQNHVEIMAQICFDIVNEDSYSTFNVAAHYISKDSDGRKLERTNFITIFAYNESLRNIVRTQLNRLDRVRVEGTLKHKACVDNAGKKQYKGYIEANKISKLIVLRRETDVKAQSI